jgi:hypothetical protein
MGILRLETGIFNAATDITTSNHDRLKSGAVSLGLAIEMNRKQNLKDRDK